MNPQCQIISTLTIQQDHLRNHKYFNPRKLTHPLYLHVSFLLSRIHVLFFFRFPNIFLLYLYFFFFPFSFTLHYVKLQRANIDWLTECPPHEVMVLILLDKWGLYTSSSRFSFTFPFNLIFFSFYLLYIFHVITHHHSSSFFGYSIVRNVYI